MSLRDRIFAIEDLPKEDLPVPEWEGVVLEIRGMTGLERSRFMQDFTDPDTGQVNYELMYPSLVVNSTYDPESGERVFQETDLHNLNAKSGLALERIATVAMRLSGMDQKAEDRLGKPSSPASDVSTLS